VSGNGAVVTVGTFDGVHRGHQAVAAEVVRRARAAGRRSVLVTFDPHPLEVVNPAAAPHLLTLPDERAELLGALGLDRVVVLPFTPELSRLAPDEFVRRVLRADLGMEELVLGHDHGFGRGRSGDLDTLRRLGAADGFGVDVVEPVRDDGQPISSTLIRAAVAHGQLEQVARWLGRPYTVRGRVVPGAGRGRVVGVPTINLAPPDPRKLLPPDGVYAVWVTIEGAGGKGPGAGSGERGAGRGAPRASRRYGGMMNQGPRPTFGEDTRTLEAHLFDFAGDLSGATVTVEWVRRLRDVQAFPSREALVAQLERDRVAARAGLNL
jgi:riboflavin kinase/FMN adenylyltransferase